MCTVRFEVLMVLTVKNTIFSLAEIYQFQHNIQCLFSQKFTNDFNDSNSYSQHSQNILTALLQG